MTTILVTVIMGAIIGGLARLVMPGHQNISLPMTILLGILGSGLGSWLATNVLGYGNANGGIAWIGVAIGVAMACALIAIYLAVTGRKGAAV